MTTEPLTSPAVRRRLGLPEFTAMLAMLYATIAVTMDGMLPALPEIAAELTPEAVNRAQLILTAFMLGMGAGTLFVGPISDAIGRKPTIALGGLFYVAGALLAWHAPTIELMLLARCLQGLGAAGPRIAGLALVRDLYQGREMARVTSFVMMIFMLVPAVAPSLGALVIHATGWRSIFLAFVIFSLVPYLWIGLRQPETLPPERRRPLRIGPLAAAAREVMADREVRLYTVVMTLGFGQMIAVLSSAQQLFDITYGRGENFPLWFAAMAVLAGTGTLINARFVMRLGMRRIVTLSYLMQTVMSAVMLCLLLTGALPAALQFPAFFVWVVSVFFMAGVTFGNLNALALQRMGHIAGMAASIVSAISTMVAVAIAAPLGLAFDGTARPLAAGVLACSLIAYLLMRRTLDEG